MGAIKDDASIASELVDAAGTLYLSFGAYLGHHLRHGGEVLFYWHPERKKIVAVCRFHDEVEARAGREAFAALARRDAQRSEQGPGDTSGPDVSAGGSAVGAETVEPDVLREALADPAAFMRRLVQ